MMSLPDFREKQLLIITATEAMENRLQFKNENICFTKDGEIINQLSCHKVFCLFVVGDFSITTVLIRNCAQYGVSLVLIKDNFLPYASIVSTATGNYLLREKQYLAKDDHEIAKHLVANKITNQKILLGKIKGKKSVREFFIEMKSGLSSVDTGKQLLGFEGSASKAYFSEYFSELGWYRRMPRTKVDEINVLMDIGYTILFNFIDALLGIFGFDTYKGVYHKLFFQRKSLVCDIVEPFRSIIDHQIVKSYNLGQIDKKDFKKRNGKYDLSFEQQRKYVLIFSQAMMDRKEDLFVYVRDYYYAVMNETGEYPVFFID